METSTKKEINLSAEITALLLDGGQVVVNENSGKNTTILIRMPKGKFIQDDRLNQEDNSFEYVMCQDFMALGKVRISGWRNESLAKAKKQAHKEHNEITWSK